MQTLASESPEDLKSIHNSGGLSTFMCSSLAALLDQASDKREARSRRCFLAADNKTWSPRSDNITLHKDGGANRTEEFYLPLRLGLNFKSQVRKFGVASSFGTLFAKYIFKIPVYFSPWVIITFCTRGST